MIPPIPGLDRVSYLTNETIMELTEVPEHLLVLGGGYIGLEFGQMFSRFGSRVTIIQNSDQIVPREDPEIAAELQRALEAEGIRFCSAPHDAGREKGRRNRPDDRTIWRYIDRHRLAPSGGDRPAAQH